MSDEVRISRPPVSGPQPAPRIEPASTGEAPKGGGSKMPWLILAAVVVILIILGVLFRDKLFGGKTMSNSAAGAPSGYQAVFLTNGQVYFGKLLEKSREADLTLKDIFYLQVIQPPLQGQGAGTSTPPAQPQISLVKLGQELHGPVDEMHISRSQVLFYEDLKKDSKVVEAIQNYKANPPK